MSILKFSYWLSVHFLRIAVVEWSKATHSELRFRVVWVQSPAVPAIFNTRLQKNQQVTLRQDNSHLQWPWSTWWDSSPEQIFQYLITRQGVLLQHKQEENWFPIGVQQTAWYCLKNWFSLDNAITERFY